MGHHSRPTRQSALGKHTTRERDEQKTERTHWRNRKQRPISHEEAEASNHSQPVRPSARSCSTEEDRGDEADGCSIRAWVPCIHTIGLASCFRGVAPRITSARNDGSAKLPRSRSACRGPQTASAQVKIARTYEGVVIKMIPKVHSKSDALQLAS